MKIGIGELYSIGAAASWGLAVVMYMRLGESVPPVALSLFKNLIVVGLMVPTVLIVHGLAPPSFEWWSLLLAILSGVLGIAVADTMFFRALNALGAGRTGIIGNLFSPFVIVLSMLFLGERLSLMQFWGFLLVMIGVVLVNQRQATEVLTPAQLKRGLSYGIGAIFLNAAGIVMAKPVLEREPFFWVALVRLSAALLPMLWLWRVLPAHHRVPSLRALPWPLLIAGAFFGQYLAMLFWLAGYKYTQASIASVLNETASVFILIFAWMFLKERLSRRKLIGVMCTLCGVAVMLL